MTMGQRLLGVIALTLTLTLTMSTYAQADDVPDLTARLEFLGNPGKLSYPDNTHTYARNVWDLQAFEGRLYVGLGNSANDGPAPNAGPVDIWAFDPKGAGFVKEATVDDEQVSFRVIDGRLVAPGIDPREDWSLGNFYRRNVGGWEKVRTLPNAIHNADMVSYGGRLWAAIATEWGAVVAESADDGQTWREHRIRANAEPFWARALSFFIHAERLYVFTSGKGGTQVFVLEDGSFRLESSIDFFPEVWRADRYAFMAASRPRVIGRATLYLSPIQVVGLPSNPDWLYVLDENRIARRVQFTSSPLPGFVRDMTVDGDGAYALVTRQKQGGGTESRVYRSTDLNQWQALFAISTRTFVRSFEILDGDFYFALGSVDSNVRPETGDVFRLQNPAR